MDSRAERKTKLEAKIRIWWIVAIAQVWLWPLWFAYAVPSGPIAVSSFITMLGGVIYNVCQLINHYDKVSDLFLPD